MKLLEWEIKPIYIILITCFLCYTLLNFQMHVLDWDALSYIMNGRTLVGSESYFEWHRPILWPLMIAMVLGNELLTRILGVLLSVFSVWAIYLLGRESLNEEAGLFSSAAFSVLPIIVYWAPRLYTEIPVIGLSAMALYYLLRYTNSKKTENKDLYFFFVFCGLAYLMRYVGLLTFFVGLIYLVIKGRLTLKNLRIFVVGIVIFLSIVAPWLWFNYINTGDMFFSPRVAEAQMSRIESQNQSYYLSRWGVIFTYPLTLLVLAGLFFYLKDTKLNKIRKIKDVFKIFQRDRGYILFLGMFLAFFIYFQFMLNLKLMRYILPALLGWVVLSGYGLARVTERLKFSKDKVHMYLLGIFIFSIIVVTLSLIPEFQMKNGFDSLGIYFEDKEGNVASNVWPYITYYTSNTAKWIPMYYSEFVEETQKYNIKYLVIFEDLVLEPEWAHSEFIDQKEEWIKLEKFRTFLGVVVVYEYKYPTSGSLTNDIVDPLSSNNFKKLRWI